MVLLLMYGFYGAIAQDENNSGEEKKKGFKKENLFTGGDITLAFSNYYTALGASPYFGYSVNKYLDIAASFNFTYISQRDISGYGVGDKLRQTVYGPGAFVRIFPLKFLFGQAQFEHNFVKLKYFWPGNTGISPETNHFDVNSFLVGGGYASGRGNGNNNFYYLSVSWDLIRNKNSPYVDALGRAVPIFRAGYNIALFQGGRNRR